MDPSQVWKAGCTQLKVGMEVRYGLGGGGRGGVGWVKVGWGKESRFVLKVGCRGRRVSGGGREWGGGGGGVKEG